MTSRRHRASRALRRWFARVDRRLIEAHFSSQPGLRKLHLGCGNNRLEGWLNSDFHPASREVLHLDATRRFPFAEGSFDLVFSEHMIEHLPYTAGAALLAECFRVLRPGGRVRISTPDLAFLGALHSTQRTALQQAYLEWSASTFLPPGAPAEPGLVINNFMRDWGHQCIYDEAMLRGALARAAFAGIRRCGLNDSAEPALRGLEHEGRMPPGFLRLETMTFEATRPAG